jgi:hypothetical protein
MLKNDNTCRYLKRENFLMVWLYIKLGRILKQIRPGRNKFVQVPNSTENLKFEFEVEFSHWNRIRLNLTVEFSLLKLKIVKFCQNFPKFCHKWSFILLKTIFSTQKYFMLLKMWIQTIRTDAIWPKFGLACSNLIKFDYIWGLI